MTSLRWAPAGAREGGSDTTSPYEWTYSWDRAGGPIASTIVAVALDGSAASADLQIVADSTAPTGVSISTASQLVTTSPDIDFSAGTDTGSGIGRWQLQKRSAWLVNDRCASSLPGVYQPALFMRDTGPAQPQSPYVAQLSPGHCVEYGLWVKDRVGNYASACCTGWIIWRDISLKLRDIVPLTGTEAMHVDGARVWFNPSKSGSFVAQVEAASSSSNYNVVFSSPGSGWAPASDVTQSASMGWPERFRFCGRAVVGVRRRLGRSVGWLD